MFRRYTLSEGETRTAEQISTEINEHPLFKFTIGATVENGNVVVFVRNPIPNQVLAIDTESGSKNVAGTLGLGGEVNSRRLGPKPNWERVSVQDIFPFLKDIAQLIQSVIDGFIESFRSAVDSVIDFIDLISLKIDQIQQVIDELTRFLESIRSFFLGSLQILRIPPVPGGVPQFISTFQSATGGPDSDESGITFGTVILVGGPNANAQFTALSIFF